MSDKPYLEGISYQTWPLDAREAAQELSDALAVSRNEIEGLKKDHAAAVEKADTDVREQFSRDLAEVAKKLADPHLVFYGADKYYQYRVRGGRVQFCKGEARHDDISLEKHLKEFKGSISLETRYKPVLDDEGRAAIDAILDGNPTVSGLRAEIAKLKAELEDARWYAKQPESFKEEDVLEHVGERYYMHDCGRSFEGFHLIEAAMSVVHNALCDDLGVDRFERYDSDGTFEDGVGHDMKSILVAGGVLDEENWERTDKKANERADALVTQLAQVAGHVEEARRSPSAWDHHLALAEVALGKPNNKAENDDA